MNLVQHLRSLVDRLSRPSWKSRFGRAILIVSLIA